jgi:S-adenosylmethionine:tRNA ribosyltransferase-isomerase
MAAHAPFRFELPDELSAQAPPEKRGLSRDGLRLLAADRRTGNVTHARFDRIADFLHPGDCLVFNASRTLPAVLPAMAAPAAWGERGPESGAIPAGAPERAADGIPAGTRLQIRLARRWGDGLWSVLILDANEEPWIGDFRGTRLAFSTGAPGGSGGLTGEVLERDPCVERLWKIRFSLRGQDLMQSLSRLGSPVRYWYAAGPWGLDDYQTVYAREPGSVEMPSAGRAFTWKLLMDLRRKGVGTAFLVLHAGLSSYMDEEYDARKPASVESFRLEEAAARAVNQAKSAGGRIIAVGTTVVRALESIADHAGRVRAAEGETALRIFPGYRLKSVDGLLTGFHEPAASHLDLLTAFMPPDRLKSVYDAALRGKYLWHEFGDANLIL